MAHPTNVVLMESLFPLASASFRYNIIDDEAPGLWFGTSVERMVLPRLLMSEGKFAL